MIFTHCVVCFLNQACKRICEEGFNPDLRTGQALGPGEYFALDPEISVNYSGPGNKMVVAELLLGEPDVDHTQHDNVIVMKEPANDLPRFVITFI